MRPAALGWVLLLAPAAASALEVPPAPEEPNRDEEIFGPTQADTDTDTAADTATAADPAADPAAAAAAATATAADPAAAAAADPATATDPVPAPDSARDDEIFGGAAFEEDAGHGVFEQSGGLLAEKLDLLDDTLDIGGFAFARIDYFAQTEGKADGFPLSAPALIDLYLDARPTERLRFYLRGRLNHRFAFDPAGQPGSLIGVGDALSGASAGPGEEPARTTVALDQLWLKLDIDRTVFLTLGQQPIRWGSGRLWNPTDFLNRTRRNPLAVFDERLGVSVLKAHIPVESLGWNFYVIANLEGVDEPGDVGAALRAEIVFWQAEVALSATVQSQQPVQLGVDLSMGIWELDIRAEAAFLNGVRDPFYRGTLDIEGILADPLNFDPSTQLPQEFSRRDDWLVQVMGGVEVAIKYSDEDSLFIGAEYFYNQLGYDDPDLYPWLLFEGQFEFLYTGKHYAGAYIALPGPGSWNDTSFILNGIGNLSDRSFITRLDYQVTVLTRLSFNLYGAVFFGKRGGEFRLAFDVPPIPNVALIPSDIRMQLPPGIENGVSFPPPALQVGAGVRLSF